MNRRLIAVVVVGACSSPSSPAIDASIDVAGDTNAVCASDQDLDGVCDDIDRRPTTFDPGQVDLDGDMIGWACDPVETFELPTVGVTYDVRSEIVNHTLGATVASCAGEDCLRVAFAVSPLGTMLARSDSDAPADAWIASSLSVFNGINGPYISRDERLFWSTRTLSSPATGVVDLATKSFTQLRSEDVWRRTDQRLPADLLITGVTQASTLVVPQNAQLTELATSTGYYTDVDLSLQTTRSQHSITIPERTGATYSLSRYVPATGTTDVIETGLKQLRQARRDPKLLDEISYCAESGSQAFYVGVRDDLVIKSVLPFNDCYSAGPVAKAVKGRWFLSGAATGNRRGVAYIHDGHVTPVFADEPAGDVKAYGDEVRVVTMKRNADSSTRVWLVTPTATVVSIPDVLTDVTVSVHGGTAHIVGRQGGAVVLIRYRVATGVQNFTISAAPFFGPPLVVTTPEGAALVAADATWALASTSGTPVALNLRGFEVAGVSGQATMISAADTGPLLTRSIYAYDELAGPRVTLLVATPSVGVVPVFSSEDDLVSEWFMYSSSGLHAARIRYVGMTPMLDSYSIGNDGSFQIAGRRANGDLIARSFGGVYVVNESGIVPVATGEGPLQVYVDQTVTPPIVVGWSGTDAVGNFACLASHPERCWAATGTELSVSAAGDGSFALLDHSSSSATELMTVFRTIGNGNRPQP